ncbi:unnamed protein product, partial [Soboliphyme baturini]|uniref:protein-disulfide reductase n=1 Tax=Soboliphyme baturini TaxID=241478 RepID=A0A183JAV6_9BILA
MAELLKDQKIMQFDGKSGKEVDAQSHLQGKVVGLYFSAHWCPPCKTFTPILKDFYDEVGNDNFEIVFVSLDHNEPDLMTYLSEAHGHWCYFPVGDPNIKKLSDKYKVTGIPTLVIIKPNGDVITSTARTI